MRIGITYASPSLLLSWRFTLVAMIFTSIVLRKPGWLLVDSVNAQQPKSDLLPAKDIGYYREALGLSESEKQTVKARRFPNVPLIVLSATFHGGSNSQYNTKANKLEWVKLQAQLANMSTKSEHVTANNAEHDIQKGKAWLVIAAIKQIMTD